MVFALLGALAAIFLPRYWRAVDAANYEGCRQNLLNLATAVQVWSNEHDGAFPDSLGQLVPDFIEMVPTCPAARTDTYTAGYSANPEVPVFTIVCRGRNHAPRGAGADEPYYVYAVGLGPKL